MAEQNDNDDNRQWFLRINGETVFGPVSTQGLIVWAEQGRILPGHEVSPDRKKWMQAVSLDLLDMRWFVDDSTGELRGPLNRLAAEALIKSGKVAEGAQLVSADEVEEAADAAADASPAKTADAQQRIRELEKQAAELEPLRQQVKKLERKLKEADAGGARVTELEQQIKDASGGARAAQLELSVQHHERKAEETAQAFSAREAELEAARAKVKACGKKLEELEARARDAEASLEQQLKDADSSGVRIAQLEQAVRLHERKAEETAQILSTRETELEAARAEVEVCGQKLEESQTALQNAESRADAAETARQETEAKLRDAEAVFQSAEARADAAVTAKLVAERRVSESEAEMTGLLTDANARDISYQEKIAELEKRCSQSPEEIARFIADQAAVYELIKAEVAELATALESERSLAEQLKTWSVQRQQSLLERRQKLLKHLGGSPTDMTRRAGRDQASVDLQAARLRAELESLRVTHQREMQLVETKDREWQERVNALQSEESRLRAQIGVADKKAQRVQELEEMVGMREHELSSERKAREDEREQFDANQRTLLMRIETLERSSKPGTPEEVQAVEARNVKLASWMRLKK